MNDACDHDWVETNRGRRRYTFTLPGEVFKGNKHDIRRQVIDWLDKQPDFYSECSYTCKKCTGLMTRRTY